MLVILLVSHDHLAPALARAAQALAGPQAGFAALAMGADEAPAAFSARVGAALSGAEGALILADLAGGAPCQAALAAARALRLPRGWAVVGGASLGMVVEALLARDDAPTAPTLAARVVAAAHEHIRLVESRG